MLSRFDSLQDPRVISKIWIAFIILSLSVFLLFVAKTYYSFDAFGIWIISCLAVVYISRQKIDYLNERQRIVVIIIGLFICVLSFASIPLGISKPPYSIGEYSVLLSGMGLIFFGIFKMKSLILPISIPCVAILGYDGYKLFIEYADKITAPFVPFTASLVTTILQATGIQAAISDGNIITFLSQSGSSISIVIIGECTGIVSLGTFTIALIIVLTSFPQSRTRESLGIIAIGYFGTYCANIGRIILIVLSGYFFGPRGVMEQVHIHIGWILFSSWMIIFWYYFFTRYLGFSIFNKNENQRII